MKSKPTISSNRSSAFATRPWTIAIACCITVFSFTVSANAQPQRIAKNRRAAENYVNLKLVFVISRLPFLLTDESDKDDDKKNKDKQLAERERRLKSLAKGIESENRLERPSFANRKRTGNSITFDDIKFEMEKGDRFDRKMLTPSINDLVGERIQIKGFIRPSIKQRGLTKFIFVRDDKECCFGPGAALYDCVLVTLAKGKKNDYTVRPITVEGEFFLKEFKGPDGKTWAVYRMKECVVKR